MGSPPPRGKEGSSRQSPRQALGPTWFGIQGLQLGQFLHLHLLGQVSCRETSSPGHGGPHSVTRAPLPPPKEPWGNPSGQAPPTPPSQGSLLPPRLGHPPLPPPLAQNFLGGGRTTLPHPPLPAILGSPSRRRWGQCCSILIKKGFVTPSTTFGLRRKRPERKGEREGTPQQDPPLPLPAHSAAKHSRGLCPGGVLLELAVMDGEIGAVVAAVLQRSQAAGGGREGGRKRQGLQRRSHLAPPTPAGSTRPRTPLPGLRGWPSAACHGRSGRTLLPTKVLQSPGEEPGTESRPVTWSGPEPFLRRWQAMGPRPPEAPPAVSAPTASARGSAPSGNTCEKVGGGGRQAQEETRPLFTDRPRGTRNDCLQNYFETTLAAWRGQLQGTPGVSITLRLQWALLFYVRDPSFVAKHVCCHLLPFKSPREKILPWKTRLQSYHPSEKMQPNWREGGGVG